MDSESFARVRALSSRGNVIPIWRELPADCLTPVLSFLSAAARSRRAFLLESVEGGERIARYSFVGRDPWRVLTVRGRSLRLEDGRRVVTEEGDFLEALRAEFAALHPAPTTDLPRFTGGAVGWISYDAVRLFERLQTLETARKSKGRGAAKRLESLPDAWFGFYDTALAFDHLRQSILLITSLMTDRASAPLRRQHAAAVARLDRLASDLSRRLPRAPALTGRAHARSRAERPAPAPRDGLTPAARVGQSMRAYQEMVETARRYIGAGDIYQVVLSQRFRRRLSGDPFSVYRALRRINPSPYMYYLRDGVCSLAGASPEMLVRVEAGMAEVHPIAGTRPRGRDPQEDARLEADLRADAKERAEHVMLVDLGRNDLGRVCAAGAVSVPELMTVQRFSHVMHLVSRVTGRLAPGRDAFDALRAVFPAGTVSGAPKVRAMEIIQELERSPRGPYAGAVCYIDHSGNLDSCITIRTMVSVGRDAWVQAGGGIVADSDARSEYRESVNKARAVLAAIEGARRWGR